MSTSEHFNSVEHLQAVPFSGKAPVGAYFIVRPNSDSPRSEKWNRSHVHLGT
jgi:hypothetical protein